MTAVDLKDGGEKQYLELESFYSEIHKEAVKQGLRSGWSVWKRTPKKEMKIVLQNISYLTILLIN